MTGTPAEIVRSRIRRYFLVVFGLFVGAAALLVVLGVTVKSVFDPQTAAKIVGVSFPIVGLAVVLGSWVAVSKLWRCPACNASLYWTISWNMSLFARSASRTCPSCQVELFTEKGQKRGFRVLLIMVLVAFGAGVLGAAVTATKTRKEKTVEAAKP